MGIEIKVMSGPENKVVLLKRKTNGSWNNGGKKSSLKALYDGINAGRFSVAEWDSFAKRMYSEYSEKKSMPNAVILEPLYT